MIKKILCTLVAVVLAGSLAACEQLTSRTGQNVTTESAETAVKITTIAPAKGDPHWDYEEEGPAEWRKKLGNLRRGKESIAN